MFEHTRRRPGGWMISTDADGKTIERDSVLCVHCGCHFLIQPGSGKTRGFCTGCMGMTCGAAGCMACYPFEQKLTDYEKGKLLVL